MESFRDPRSGRVIFMKNPEPQAVEAALSRVTPRTTPVTRPEGAQAGTDPVLLSDAFLEVHGRAYGLEDPVGELVPVQVKRDRFGNRHAYYHQVHQGVPVFGSEILVHLGAGSAVLSSNGRIVSGLSVSPEAAVTKEEAVATAKASFLAEHGIADAEAMSAGLYVLNLGLIRNREDPESRQVWKVKLHRLEPLLSESVFVDAHSGKILFRLDEVARSNPNPVNRRVYDCSMNFFSSGTGCGLNNYFRLVDYSFGCLEGNCPRGPNPLSAPYGGTTDVDDLYYLLSHVHDYTWNTFARSGGNGRGGIGDSQSHSGGSVHYPFDSTTGWVYLDAIGQDCSQIASWTGYAVTFCRGAVVTDVVGHEYGHSFTWFHSFNPDDTVNTIPLFGESGALVENYADVFSEGVERYVHGGNDWIFINDPILGQYRDFADPPRLAYQEPQQPAVPSPDRLNDPNLYCGDWDNGGIHINANVLNKAAYLVSEGGAFNGCSITGIGFAKMEQLWYHAMEYHYTVNATFNDAYHAINQACAELQTAGVMAPGDCQQVQKALQAVELDQAGTCSGIPGVPPAVLCPGRTARTPTWTGSRRWTSGT